MIQKMLDYLTILAQAGVPPRVGDDDGGRLFDPRRNQAKHLLDPLATGAAVFGRADFKAAAGGPLEETLWLLGLRGLAQFDQLQPDFQPVRSVAFRESGIFLMADSFPAKQQLVIDAGPQGGSSAGHGHADGLDCAGKLAKWLACNDSLSVAYRVQQHRCAYEDARDDPQPDGWRSTKHGWAAPVEVRFVSESRGWQT